MNKWMRKLIALGIFILTLNIFYCDRAGVAADQSVGGTSTIGRDDPFGGDFGQTGQQSDLDISSADTPQPMAPLFVRTMTLKFLNAANLKNALAKMSSDRGSISVDDNTNTLIICDTRENLEKILAEIKKADQTPPQIMIEVVIIDVQLKNDTEIGVDWDFLTTDNKRTAYRQSLIFPNRLSIVPSSSTTIGDITAFSPVGLGSELSIIHDDIRNVVSLLQEKRNVDILASPRVMVVSGQKAEIRTIEEIPYQQVTQSSAGGGGASAITSTEFKDVGVTMEVKATVTDDAKILLVVKPEQSVSTGVSIGGVPVIDKRGASTTLLMDDGQVVMMGGLRRQEITHIKEQVPLLGDLPLIGFIFADDRKVVENSELLVLLSPHIYKNEPISPEEMERFRRLTGKSTMLLPGEPDTNSLVEIGGKPKK